MRLLLLCAAVLLGSTSWVGAQEAPKPKPDPHREVRGVTLSCQTWGWEWGSDAMLAALDAVKAQGGNWVAIHPYAGIRRTGAVRTFRLPEKGTPKWIRRPIVEAKKRGLKVLIKPHLAYWGSGFSWRGAITFQTEAAWERFFRDYTGFVVRLARLSQGADAFAVGTELGGTTQHTQRWRKVIAEVRKVTQVPLTYAANWDRYRQVAFWDALDVIGIQAYFPLVSHTRTPTATELEKSWRTILGRITTYARKQRRKVVFTELGYDRSPLAAREPWKSGRRIPDPDRVADTIQTRCMTAALRAVKGDPTVVGSFLWKAFAGSTRGEDFLISRPAVDKVIRAVWKPKRKPAAKPAGDPAKRRPPGSRDR